MIHVVGSRCWLSFVQFLDFRFRFSTCSFGPSKLLDGVVPGSGRRDGKLAGETVGRALAPPVPSSQRRLQRDRRPGRYGWSSLGPEERGGSKMCSLLTAKRPLYAARTH